MLFKACLGVELTLPFPRISYHDAMNRYGKDAPDIRFGLRIEGHHRQRQQFRVQSLPGGHGRRAAS